MLILTNIQNKLNITLNDGTEILGCDVPTHPFEVPKWLTFSRPENGEKQFEMIKLKEIKKISFYREDV